MYDPETPIEPRGLNTAAAARYLGLSTSFLEKARLKNPKTPGPNFRRKGTRVLYLKCDLDAYLESSE